MKKMITNTKWLLTFILFSLLAGNTFSQDVELKDTAINNPNDTLLKKGQRIIIKKDSRDGKQETMTITINGDKVLINGKSADQLGDKDIRIFKGEPGDFILSGPGTDENGLMRLSPHKSQIKPLSNRALLGVMTEKSEKGAKITEVTKKSAAEIAGLKKEDIITKINDTKITGPEDLRETIGKFKPEEKIKITYLRNAKESTVTATLSRPKTENLVINGEPFNFSFPDQNFDFSNSFISHKPRLGLQISDIEEGTGVKVTGVDEESPAEKAGLKEEDIIKEINGSSIKDVDDLRSRIKDLKEGDIYKVKYERGGKTNTVDIKIPKKLKTANL
jgi:serine protease Do